MKVLNIPHIFMGEMLAVVTYGAAVNRRCCCNMFFMPTKAVLLLIFLKLVAILNLIKRHFVTDPALQCYPGCEHVIYFSVLLYLLSSNAIILYCVFR